MLFAFALTGSSRALAQELLFFPRVVLQKTSAQTDAAAETAAKVGSSAFYSNDWQRLRALVEFDYQYERDRGEVDHDAEFERAQLGWKFDSSNSVWLGRYHSPGGFWNTEHHHGALLQTSVTRPRISDFEDHGGPLPVHLFGLLYQSSRASGDGMFLFDMGVASGPRMEQDGLEPVAVLRGQHWGRMALVARATWRPDAAGETQGGVFLAQTRIPSDLTANDEIRQTLGGAGGTWDAHHWHLLSELYWVRNQFRASGNAASFVSGQVQLERHLDQWTLFARQESTASARNDPYLALFADFPKARTALGVRFDITPRQALTLELARHVNRDSTGYNEAAVQWSTVLP